jgi:DNA replication and repair protein RecF
MHVTHLALVDFRSYPSVDLVLEPGVSALIGPNGQGKTNLVEAIGYLATQTSHRVAADAPLVRSGADRAVVRGAVVRGARRAVIELEIVPGGGNRARVNRSPVQRPREALGLLRSVLFAPEDLALVKGDPDGRRRFLDELLIVRAPRLAGVRSDYERVLRQRNALLKTAGSTIRSGRGDVRTLDVWDTHLAVAGAELLAARLRLVHELGPLVSAAYQAVSAGQGGAGQGGAGPGGAGPGGAELGYRSSLGEEVTARGPLGREELRDLLLEALARSRPQELERGVSLVGPHRDDLVLTIAGLPAKGYASHGESWSCALALRLGSYHLLRAEADQDAEPVLLLDDVFAELDTGRRARLTELVAGAEQVIITAAVPQDVPQELRGSRFDVAGGQVNRVR